MLVGIRALMESGEVLVKIPLLSRYPSLEVGTLLVVVVILGSAGVVQLTQSPTILMYHAVGTRDESAGRYIVPYRHFVRQMRWLKTARCNILTLEELLECRRVHRLPPARSVVITFDDGYRDNWKIAYPVLRQYGFAATIFLASQFIGKANEWDSGGELAGRPLLSWAEIREMQRGGICFGAHSRTYPRLTALSPNQAEAEIRGSRQDLANQLGPILSLAYPHGAYDENICKLVEHAGYLGACSSDPGPNDARVSRFRLRGMEIRGDASFLDFALALWLGQTRVLERLWNAQ